MTDTDDLLATTSTISLDDVIARNVQLRLGDAEPEAMFTPSDLQLVNIALDNRSMSLSLSDIEQVARAVDLTTANLLSPYCGFGEWKYYGEPNGVFAFVNPQGKIIARCFRELMVLQYMNLWCADIADSGRVVFAWRTFSDDAAAAMQYCKLHLFQADRFK